MNAYVPPEHLSLPANGPSSTVYDTALVIKPQVAVRSDTTITLNARTARPFQVKLGPPVKVPPIEEDDLKVTRTSVTGGGVRESQSFGLDAPWPASGPNRSPGKNTPART